MIIRTPDRREAEATNHPHVAGYASSEQTAGPQHGAGRGWRGSTAHSTDPLALPALRRPEHLGGRALNHCGIPHTLGCAPLQTSAGAEPVSARD
jgi:hypothetical protein